jgi:hypothetical protein
MRRHTQSKGLKMNAENSWMFIIFAICVIAQAYFLFEKFHPKKDEFKIMIVISSIHAYIKHKATLEYSRLHRGTAAMLYILRDCIIAFFAVADAMFVLDKSIEMLLFVLVATFVLISLVLLLLKSVKRESFAYFFVSNRTKEESFFTIGAPACIGIADEIDKNKDVFPANFHQLKSHLTLR